MLSYQNNSFFIDAIKVKELLIEQQKEGIKDEIY